MSLGGRTSAEIVKWINKKTGPAATTVTSQEELAAVTKVFEPH